MLRAVVPLCVACSALGNGPERNALCWPSRAGEDSPQGAPVLPQALPRAEVQEAGRVCSVPGVPSSEGPMQFRSQSWPSPAWHTPPPLLCEERPGHGKPNLKGNQRPGLQQSELENVTIVPPET